MTKHRTVERVVAGRTVREGAGFLVHRPFPTPDLDMLDPFLLMDEMGPSQHGPGEAEGAPDHPHRGFETVTYLISGEMEHHDSHGHRGVLRPGGVQWMTAGSGVIHSEMPTREFQKLGGRMHGFQIWVNLPRERKMDPPRYQEIANILPVTLAPNVSARIISGTIDGHQGPADTVRPVTIAHLELGEGASADIEIGTTGTAAIWSFEGSITVADRELAQYELAILSREGERIGLSAGTNGGSAMLLMGDPLNEPVARYGPFVMNDRAGIIQAVEDFEAGRFGSIPATIRQSD